MRGRFDANLNPPNLTPTGALEMLLNVMPINEFILSEAVKGSYRLSRVSFWPRQLVQQEKPKVT